MIGIKLICVGKMREKYFIDAFNEYKKRLGAYCSFECAEISEYRLSDNPSKAEIENALSKEASEIKKQIPANSSVICMCIEGTLMSSEQLSSAIMQMSASGRPRLCFIIGGSYGLSPEIKQLAALRLSMSPMTFPHHFARVMLSEQIYRSFKISEGSKYHK